MFTKNDGRAPLLTASLVISLTAVLIVYGMLASNSFASASPDNLTLTLTTNKSSYQNGETIYISGMVQSSGGTTVETGVVTILFSCGEWSRKLSVEIDDGAYAGEYIISFGDQVGQWTILASAVDGSGNTGEKSRNITVALPSSTAYNVSFLSPPNNIIRLRGSAVTLSIQVEEGTNFIDGADVSYRSPTNDVENITPVDNTPGTYSAAYTLKWDDPIGDWCISAEAKKGTKTGGNYTIVDVQPAVLQLDLLSPSEREFEVGEQTEIKVRVSYPDETLVAGATVILSVSGRTNVVLTGVENGVYKSSAIKFENAGGQPISMTVTDANGNAGSGSYVFNIVSPQIPVSVIFILAMVAVVLAIGISAAFLTRKKVSSNKLETIRAEKKQIVRLQTETARKYFKEGSISRETYDSLMQEHARRLAELDKEERKRAKKAKEGKKKPKKAPKEKSKKKGKSKK